MVDLNFDDDLDPAGIGFLCIRWSYLEYLLAIVIWQILGLDEETGVMVTSGLDIQPRCSMAKNLACRRKAPQPLLEHLKIVSIFIEEHKDERNLIVHGIYGMNPDTLEIQAETHRGKNRGKKQPMNNKRIAKLTSELDDLATDFEKTLMEIGYCEF